MPTFAFVARDTDGQSQSGTIDGANERGVFEQLRARGWLVVDLQPEARRELARRPVRKPWRRPRSIEISDALRQLALMLDAGLTLLDSLRSVAEHANRPMRLVLEDVAMRIEGGSDLAQAMAHWPKTFPPLMVELVRAGEMSGSLERSFTRSADHLDARRQLRASVAQALFYPAIVLALTVVVVGFMVTNVIPELEKFLGAGKQLPAVTRAMLAASHAAARWAGPVALAMVVFVTVIAFARKVDAIARVFDRMLLALPVIGTVRRLSGTALFSRSLSVLLGNGVVITQALEVVARVLPYPIARHTVVVAKDRVLRGGALADALRNSRAFSSALWHLTGIGERSGALDRVLDDCARFHELALASWIRRASYLVEPVITIVIGSIVGFVYVAFFVAMFSITGG